MKERRITEECWLELYHTCKSVIDNHGGDPEAAKAWVEKAFAESCENISRQAHELFLKAIDLIHDLEKKKAANPHADQSKGLTANNTAGTGRCGNYTTAAARNQEGRNGNE